MRTEENKYEEWLTTIANTRLIYNTLDELEAMLDNHSIHSNGVKRSFSSPEKLRAAFRDLKVETALWTDDQLDLVDVLNDYKQAWTFFRENLQRRADPKAFVLELLRYCYPPYQTNGIGRKKAALFDTILDQGISVPFLLLMLLKMVPGYDSKEGDIIDMPYRYEEAMTLLAEFTEGNTFMDLTPSITQGREEPRKCRLMLLYHVMRILQTYLSYSDPEQTYQLVNELKERRLDLDLAGYWNETGGKITGSDFWQLETTKDASVYFATRWHKDADNKLTGTRHTMFLSEGTDGRLMVYLIHPEYIVHRMKGITRNTSDVMWYAADMPQGAAPLALPLVRLQYSNAWELKLDLTRVTDESDIRCYDALFKKCEIVDAFAASTYTFHPCIHAITRTHLYIPSENEGEYYKVPRDAHEGFDQLHLDVNVGLMEMNGKYYLAFDEFLLYIGTGKAELKKYGIERVNSVD